MSYAFPPDVKRLVEEQLSTGQYNSEDDVLRNALQALKFRSVEVAAIAEGIADMEAGRFRSLDDVDAELSRKLGLPRDS